MYEMLIKTIPMCVCSLHSYVCMYACVRVWWLRNTTKWRWFPKIYGWFPMYVCMHVCIGVYMHENIAFSSQTLLYLDKCIHKHKTMCNIHINDISTYMYANTNMFVYVYTNMPVCAHTNMPIYAYTKMFIYAYTNMLTALKTLVGFHHISHKCESVSRCLCVRVLMCVKKVHMYMCVCQVRIA